MPMILGKTFRPTFYNYIKRILSYRYYESLVFIISLMMFGCIFQFVLENNAERICRSLLSNEFVCKSLFW